MHYEQDRRTTRADAGMNGSAKPHSGEAAYRYEHLQYLDGEPLAIATEAEAKSAAYTDREAADWSEDAAKSEHAADMAQEEEQVLAGLRNDRKVTPRTCKVPGEDGGGSAAKVAHAAWVGGAGALGTAEAFTAYSAVSNSSSAMAENELVCAAFCVSLIAAPIAIAQLKIVYSSLAELNKLSRQVFQYGTIAVIVAYLLFAIGFSSAHQAIDFTKVGAEGAHPSGGGALYVAFMFASLVLQAFGLFAAKICGAAAFYKAYGYVEKENPDYQLVCRQIQQSSDRLLRYRKSHRRFATIAGERKNRLDKARGRIQGRVAADKKQYARAQRKRVAEARDRLDQAKRAYRDALED
ncbi:hypothetical protein [Botrimarina mediterranea]|uniref:Uncharacterized protein n=1 Tax=Botrimarina mediterranea TaxID=2528022 RepID=A0A518K237_9BACT|nr:hypothetical protein [Botrimarina mediterranea]QDV71873.1 hypothetical protein Spa11_00420 [Botrimarina mediterranea]